MSFTVDDVVLDDEDDFLPDIGFESFDDLEDNSTAHHLELVDSYDYSFEDDFLPGSNDDSFYSDNGHLMVPVADVKSSKILGNDSLDGSSIFNNSSSVNDGDFDSFDSILRGAESNLSDSTAKSNGGFADLGESSSGDSSVTFSHSSSSVAGEDDEDLGSGGFSSIEDVLSHASASQELKSSLNDGSDGDSDSESIYNFEKDDDSLHGFSIDDVLTEAIDMGASDVHINSDDYVGLSILGRKSKMRYRPVVSPEIVRRVYMTITSNVAQSSFADNFELDTSYVIRRGKYRGRRTRLNVARSFMKIVMTFRIISDVILSPGELGVRGEVVDWCHGGGGVVLISGSTGSGKSTTFASIIDEVRRTEPVKIVTLEKPVEYIYKNDSDAIIVQREVGDGSDTKSFAHGLKSAMRQDPDIILVGEVRDPEEVDQLLIAAETGHLALTTIHADSPEGVVNKMKMMYQGDLQQTILSTMEQNVRGIAHQVLVRSVDGRSRSLVQSVLDVDDHAASLIGSGDISGLAKLMREREETLEHALVNAVMNDVCDVREALSKTSHKRFLRSLFAAEGVVV